MLNLVSLRRFVLAGLAGLALFATPVLAGEKAKDEPDPSVKLASVGIPVFHGHTVSNYLFLSVRLNLTPKANVAKLRDMEPYFRDVLVKAASKTSFAQANRDDLLDEPRFKAAMMVEFSKVAGPGMIQSVEILSQSPKNHP
jgi:hypothetical protein